MPPCLCLTLNAFPAGMTPYELFFLCFSDVTGSPAPNLTFGVDSVETKLKKKQTNKKETLPVV